MAKIYRVIRIKLLIPLAYENVHMSVFKRCRSDKYFSELLPTRRRQKSTGIDMERNYVTVTVRRAYISENNEQ